MKKQVKALALISGGLDSILAAKLLIDQGVGVVGLSFVSNFFNAERAFEATKQLGIPLIIYNFADEHLEMVKNPPHGYGKNMNPCIDCHALMMSKAKEIMMGKEAVLIYPDNSLKAVAERYDLVATGEVLGQRPMSQNGRALSLVARQSGLDGYLLRPLSAKLLELTEVEKSGKIDRERLLDISGRNRQRQVDMAEGYGLKDYPRPAGGCILTTPDFSSRLKELLSLWPTTGSNDVQLIKHGRAFWFGFGQEKFLLVIGREEAENAVLEKLWRVGGGALVSFEGVNGPTAVLRKKSGRISEQDFSLELVVPLEKPALLADDYLRPEELILAVANLVGYYAPRARGQKIKLSFKVK
jgi:hypothetical protein